MISAGEAWVGRHDPTGTSHHRLVRGGVVSRERGQDQGFRMGTAAP